MPSVSDACSVYFRAIAFNRVSAVKSVAHEDKLLIQFKLVMGWYQVLLVPVLVSLRFILSTQLKVSLNLFLNLVFLLI